LPHERLSIRPSWPPCQDVPPPSWPPLCSLLASGSLAAQPTLHPPVVASLPRCTATIVRLCVRLLAKSGKMFGLFYLCISS
jgi:hypothetical protein